MTAEEHLRRILKHWREYVDADNAPDMDREAKIAHEDFLEAVIEADNYAMTEGWQL